MTWVVARVAWDERSAAVQELYDSERRRHREACGPADTYAVESLVVSPGHGLELDVGDVVVELVDEGRRTLVHPPAVVVSAARPVPGGRRRSLHLLRRRLDLAPIPLGMATATFRASRVRSPAPFAEGEVTSPEVRELLLGLWALEEP